MVRRVKREVGTVSADAIRGYFIGLRRGRYSQQVVADAVGLSRRAWIDYETGKTKEIGSTVMLAALRFLQGSFDHLRELADDKASEKYGLTLAQRRLEEIAAGEVAALRDTVSEEEFSQFLREIDALVEESSRSLPRLRDLLQRARRKGDDQPPPA
jgi:transcriptional regulator with XRE-family HTH domain